MSSPLASLPTSSTTQNCPKGFDALADRIKKTALVYLLLLLNPLNLNTLKCGLCFVHCAADDQINDGSYQSSMLTKKSSRSKKFTCCQILCVPFFWRFSGDTFDIRYQIPPGVYTILVFFCWSSSHTLSFCFCVSSNSLVGRYIRSQSSWPKSFCSNWKNEHNSQAPSMTDNPPSQ